MVEVNGRRLMVTLPSDLARPAGPSRPRNGARAPRRKAGTSPATGEALLSPMQGTVIKVAVTDGQQVAEGDLVVVLEAMKMEQPLSAHRAGAIKGLTAQVGAPVSSGIVICEISNPPS